MTVKEIIFRWLKLMEALEFSSSQVQNSLPEYGKYISGDLHSSDTYSRKWREIRNKGNHSYPKDETGEIVCKIETNGFLITEFEKKGSVEKWYKVISITK